MKENIIPYLVCPHQIKRKTCQERLVLEEVFSFFNSASDEIKEGYLKCRSCGSRFPIFFGIPVITSDTSEYLRNQFPLILELSRIYGKLHKNLIADSLLLVRQAFPKDRKTLFKLTKEQCVGIIKSNPTDSYMINNYDNLLSVFKLGHPLYNFLNKYKDVSPYRVLYEFLELYSNTSDGMALEIGCGFGGFLTYLFRKAKFVFGSDKSFLKLFYASCILKHLPVKIKKYRIRMVGNITEERFIKAKPINNLTFIAGEVGSLPFRDNSLSIVSSCNVFDIINNPVNLLEEKIRVLENKGLLLSSDPSEFSSLSWKNLKIRRGQTVWQRKQEILKPRIKILEERDNIPWVIREHNHSTHIYYNHCFCGIKTRLK